jgi:transcriptional regulator with XRE-family HTH domain
MGYAEAIRFLRLKAEMSQGDLARRIGGGITNQSVSGWERGRSRPSTENLFELARIFGVAADAIMSTGAPPEPPAAAVESETTLIYAAVEEVLIQVEARLRCGISAPAAAEIAEVVELALGNLRTPRGMAPAAAIRRIIRWEVPDILGRKG